MIKTIHFCLAQCRNAQERIAHARLPSINVTVSDYDEDLAAAVVMLDRVLDSLEALEVEAAGGFDQPPPEELES